ncbi:MAG: SDR family NAD(P)-dependent oxidoreductase [Candidatus Palauibacterales bacterium]|nr:SDR family NAD(P)-dependent oxidoreductase [Candidatus Palauibacterales bacterium]MDP2483408.1 SDR family NAD(P)-dependent oxidoreductase [Candidatus Palauibacterales bacterium]
MNELDGSWILVTGASAGIGQACARRFAESGASLILWARRLDRLESLADELRDGCGVEVVTRQVDVRDRRLVSREALSLIEAGRVPDVILNNAGLASGFDPIQEGDYEDWDRMIDTNVKGLLNVTRELLPHMVSRGTGHVVNIGSTAGHQVYPKGNVYNASKFAVKALTEGINLDVAGTRVRVSSVDPGFVRTEFSRVRFHGDDERAEGVYRGFDPLTAQDVADCVHFVVTRPPHVNVFDMVLLPTAQRNVYVLDRRDPT